MRRLTNNPTRKYPPFCSRKSLHVFYCQKENRDTTVNVSWANSEEWTLKGASGRKNKASCETYSEMMDEGMTWLGSIVAHYFHDWQSPPPLWDGDKWPSNEGKWGFLSPIPPPPPLTWLWARRLPACVFVHCEVNQWLPDSPSSSHSLARGCSLEKSVTWHGPRWEMPRV